MKVGDLVDYTVCHHHGPVHGRTVRKIEQKEGHTLVWVSGIPFPVDAHQLTKHAIKEGHHARKTQ